VPPPPKFDARMVAARTLAPHVRELTFERIDGAPMTFEPGQWVNALFPFAPPAIEGETGFKRSYSIASAPDGTPRFDLAVTRIEGGPGSTWLHDIATETALAFSGPQGFFTRGPASDAPSLMVATGTGLTPMRSMIRAAIAAGTTAPLWVLLGVRHEEDALYSDELLALARANPFLRFETTLSQPRATWGGRRGYVQAHVQELWGALAATAESPPHAYVCGLERMVSSVRDLLRKDMGIARQQVHSERYD
jgi:CDP-4-dehydro-6-deoxyglucose reductase